MQNRIISRFWFCRRPWRLKINIRWTFVYFWKPNICTNKLDVEETDLSFTRFNWSRGHLCWCRFTHGWNTSSWSLGFGHRSLSFFSNTIKENQRYQARGDSSRNTTSNKYTQNQTKVPTKHNLELSNVDYVSSNKKSSLFGWDALLLCGQWSRD